MPGNTYHHDFVDSAMLACSEYPHDFLLTTDDPSSGLLPMTSLSILGSDAVKANTAKWLHQNLFRK